jgi:hypothetical protein
METSKIRDHMEVISSCGCHVGVVDRVEDERIKLTKDDPQASGHHHFIPLKWVARVEDKVYLNTDAAETRRDWEEEPVGHHPL